MKASVYFLLIVIIGCISCNKENATNPEIVESPFVENQIRILEKSNDFGINLFRDLGDNFPSSKNLFISPYSIYLALTMTYNGAAGETANEMKNTLGFSGMTKEEINVACKSLAEMLVKMDSKVVLEIANSIWYRNTFSIKPDFLKINQDYFNAEVNACDFNNPETTGLINNWVKSKTHDKIEKVIDEIDPLSLMFLINAIYFKGQWKYKFDANNTKPGEFKLSNNSTVQANFMNQKATYNFMQNDLFSALELPYGNSKFSMVILLPKPNKDVGNIMGQFTQTNWSNWCSAMDSLEINIKIPKFKFMFDSIINESLITLGMSKAFGPQADFSNIKDDVQLYISKVLHKSFVEVNEEGTEAAAVTVVEIRFTSIGTDNEKYFIADKPFVFVIKENTTQTILFTGILNNPVN